MGSDGAWSNQLVNLIVLAASQAGFSGFFAYTPAPGPGNLFMSLSAAAGTDPYGNAYPAGFQVGLSTDSAQVLIRKNGAAAEIDFPMPAFTLSNLPNIAGAVVNSNLVDLIISGPATTGALIDDWVQIIEYSNDNSGTFARGELRYIDTSQVAHVLLDWGRSDQAVHIPAGGGPFVNAETFHDVSGGSGNTCRVKKVPWNGIWLDFEGSWAGVATTNMGSLPDASYYPTQARHFPVSSNAAAAQNAAIFVPTSGAIQLVTKGGAGAGIGGCSVVYPTN